MSLYHVLHCLFVLFQLKSCHSSLEKCFHIFSLYRKSLCVNQLCILPFLLIEAASPNIEKQRSWQISKNVALALSSSIKWIGLKYSQSLLIFIPSWVITMFFEELIPLVFKCSCLVEHILEVRSPYRHSISFVVIIITMVVYKNQA